MASILRVCSDSIPTAHQTEQWEALLRYMTNEGYTEGPSSGGMGVSTRRFSATGRPGFYVYTDRAYVSVSCLESEALDAIRKSLPYPTASILTEEAHRTKPW